MEMMPPPGAPMPAEPMPAEPMPAPAPAQDYAGMLEELMDEFPELEKEAMALQVKLDDIMPEEAAPEELPEPSLDEEEELSL